MEISDEILEGKFLSETRNRFLCKVLINSEIHECYIPSASRLENYIVLKNKKVLLTLNKGSKTRTRYSLFAVKYYDRYIVLNLNYVNHLVEEYITKKGYHGNKLYKEKKINGYKADFILEGADKILVEAKGIISPRRDVLFPSVYSERAIEQLRRIEVLQKSGWKVHYFLVSLSPVVKHVIINPHDVEYYNLLTKCISDGMDIKGFNSLYIDGKIEKYRELNISF